MHRRTASMVAAILAIASVPTAAQWLDDPTPGIPRLPDGKPNLSAPAPRKDGRPSLSGVWIADKEGFKYLNNLAADFQPGQFPIQPWADALTKERMTGVHASEFPSARCLPPGIALLDRSTAAGFPFKIVQEPGLIVILYEGPLSQFRQVFLDGRPLPQDPNPSWLGYSVGKWEGDTLVVETNGLKEDTWLDYIGSPITPTGKLIERFRRRKYGNLDVEIAIDDPRAYTKPWTVTVNWQIALDTEPLEFICDNEKDQKHMVGK